jgi:iron(III) transport system ATP-binding protein
MQIELRGISKAFGDKTVIAPVSMVFSSRAFTTLLGPSGCGKTTLLRMIAGLETPDNGEILFGDEVVFSKEKGIDLPPEKRGLGFVFQDFALWPHMTVFENVAFGLRTRKDTEHLTERVTDALAAVQLQDFAARYPHQLSGGQQQRVAFARAMVVRPKCILFDEPLSALDALLREEMRGELRELTRRLDVTSIFVTHDQTEAMSLSDRIAVLHGGKLLQYASPEEVYAHPSTPFVAHFVGKSNWLDSHTMVRPEDMSIADEPGLGVYTMRVAESRFMGDGYEITLIDDMRTWHCITRKQLSVGTETLIGIQKEKQITFKEEEGEKVS